MKIKSKEEIKANYVGSIAVVPGRYKAGISSTTDWKEKAIASEGLYSAKMQEALASGARKKGLEKTSQDEWKSNAMELGSANIGRAMTKNADKQSANFEPYRAALSSLTLPERTADPIANIARVSAVVSKMVEVKKSQ